MIVRFPPPLENAVRKAADADVLALLVDAHHRGNERLLVRSPNKFLSLASYTALGDEKAGLTDLKNGQLRKSASCAASTSGSLPS